MSIAQLCKRDIVTIDTSATLREAAALMRSRHVGALVVTVAGGSGEQAVGMLTDRDLVVEILARDFDPGEVKVGQLASRHLASVPGSADIGEAVAVMQQSGVRRLLVSEDDGSITGFISADDLLDALAGELSGLAQAMRSGIVRESVERGAAPPPRPRPVFLPHGTPGMQRPITV